MAQEFCPLWSMLSGTYYVQNYAGIIGGSLTTGDLTLSMEIQNYITIKIFSSLITVTGIIIFTISNQCEVNMCYAIG